MFYCYDLLGRKGKFATVWYVGTCGKTLKLRRQYLTFDITKGCSDISSYKGQFSLRTSAILLHGIVLLYDIKSRARRRTIRYDFLSKLMRRDPINLPEESMRDECECTLDIGFSTLAVNYDDEFDVFSSFKLPRLSDDHFRNEENLEKLLASDQSSPLVCPPVVEGMINGMDLDMEFGPAEGALPLDEWKAKMAAKRRDKRGQEEMGSDDILIDQSNIIPTYLPEEIQQTTILTTNDEIDLELSSVPAPDQSTKVPDRSKQETDLPEAQAQAIRRRRVAIDPRIKMRRRAMSKVLDTSEILEDCIAAVPRRFSNWDGNLLLTRPIRFREKGMQLLWDSLEESDRMDEGRRRSHFLEAPSSAGAVSAFSHSMTAFPLVLSSPNEEEVREPVDLFGEMYVVEDFENHQMTTIMEIPEEETSQGSKDLAEKSLEDSHLAVFAKKHLYALLKRLSHLLERQDDVRFCELVPFGRVTRKEAARAFFLLMRANRDEMLSLRQVEAYGHIYMGKGSKWPLTSQDCVFRTLAASSKEAESPLEIDDAFYFAD